MEYEYGLVENALDSLREALAYYHEGDVKDNAAQYKFSILLSAHCAELLIKEILRRNHPALLYEDIDRVKDIYNDDNQTVGYKAAIQRVKKLCGVDLRQYETYLDELGVVRNKIQHFKYSINGAYHKDLKARTFSAIEFLFRDILGLRFEDYEEIIDSADIEFLHEDAAANKARKADIAKDFKEGRAAKFHFEYADGKFLEVSCPICGTECLSVDESIKCKFCGAQFTDFTALHNEDNGCISSRNILREMGRRKHLFRSRVFECPECEYVAVIQLTNGKWKCLVCGYSVSDSTYCDECGDELPNSERIYSTALSDIDANDYKFLCPACAKRYREDEEFIGYEIS